MEIYLEGFSWGLSCIRALQAAFRTLGSFRYKERPRKGLKDYAVFF